MGAARHSVAALAAVAALPVGLAGLALRPAWRTGIRERLVGPPAVPDAMPPVWVHGASVGEIRAALGLIDALRRRGDPVVASTTTTTGRALVRGLRPELPSGLAPLDHPWCVATALRRVSPRALVLVETELWPSWIAGAARRGVPVVLVSARISDRSFPRYRRARRLLRRTWTRLTAVGARGEADAERFVALGVPADRVRVTGDLKLEPADDAARLAPDLDAALSGVRLLVAGSTHASEEDAALRALDAAEAAGITLALVVAPRHPERLAEALAACERSGRRVRRRTRLGGEPLRAGEVLVLDTIGELPGVYGRAEVAFVGGSLVPVGGHNVLEPLQHGTPVVFGPCTANAVEAAALALESGAGVRVPDADALAAATVGWLRDPDVARACGARGRRALEAHRGATGRTLALLDGVIAAERRGGRAG